jgi:RNA polymerase sigma-70 factor, ECF subfamily
MPVVIACGDHEPEVDRGPMAGNQGFEATVIDLAGRRGADDPPPTVVKAARRGDHRAFTRLVDQYDDRLRALAFHLLGSREAMDEALQETYLNAYRGLAQFRGEAGIGTWLYRIAYTTCLQRLRRPERLEPTDQERLEALAPPSPDLADEVALRDEVHCALSELTPAQRVAVLLIHRDGFSYAAAAEILNVPVGTVASRVAAARATLSGTLGRSRYAEEDR